MGLFSKKLSDEELIQQNINAQEKEAEVSQQANNSDEDLSNSKLGVEITKLKAQIEGLNEQRKATNERFSRSSEETGGLREMIVETNKAVTRIEAASTKAIDLVQSVKPEELMVEVRKVDSKIEALKANLESNETMSADIMKEVKEMRRKVEFFKGVEQISKMNEEVKKELINIKKTESTIERHSNKVENIFLEVEKKYSELDNFTDATKELKRNFAVLQDELDKLKVKMQESANRKEVVSLITRFNDFEKHTTNFINLIDQKSKATIASLENNFDKMKEDTDAKVDTAIKRLNLPDDKTQNNEDESLTQKKRINIFGFLKKKKERLADESAKESKIMDDAEEESIESEHSMNPENNPKNNQETNEENNEEKQETIS